jgi:hypothetical protein
LQAKMRAEEQLKREMSDLHAELRVLREQVSAGRPTAPKDMSMVSLIPKWGGTEKSVPISEFFDTIEGAAKVGNWSPEDKIQIAILKLMDAAKTFYSGSVELHAADISWENFKRIFQARFRDVHTDQFHYMQLQTARQKRTETPQEFANRCRSLAQKTIRHSADPAAQRFQNEQAQRMLLAAFTSGLIGNPGQQVRFRLPKSMEEAMQIAITVYEAEKEEKRHETIFFSTKPQCKACGRRGHASADCYTRRQKSEYSPCCLLPKELTRHCWQSSLKRPNY